ncbi:MAG: hypothetical protein K2K92_04445 [Duncaniella sp.]|nr:hypothetical protein [Duncaniella sp.]
MTEYDYIYVALRGEQDGATRTLYAYTPTDSAVDPQWNTAMVEPVAAIKRFMNATECYVLQQSEIGHYISLITRNTVAPDRGYMMISMLVQNGCALTGRQVLGVFNGLKKTFFEEDKLDDTAVEDVLLSVGVPRQPLHLQAWEYKAPEQSEEGDAAPRAEAAYRTYISVQDLESIFSFPGQPEYGAYRCVLVVSASTSLRPGVKMPRITVPIRRQYGVVCPEGVTASADLVYDGDRLVLTYSKEGYTPHTETVVVGTPAAYTKYDGSTINIRSAAQTGIRFVRRVPISVVSAKGTPVNGFTISVNGHPVPTSDPWIEFTERDLTRDKDVEIQVASNNYRPLKLAKAPDEVLEMDELILELQPVEQGVTLRLDFGDGRVFEQQISIEKNTPEYNRLHSGNFHGFRAQRQVTSDNSEVYNVDVRIASAYKGGNLEPYRSKREDDVMAVRDRHAVRNAVADQEPIEADVSEPEAETETAGGETGVARESREETKHTAPKFENIADEATSSARPRFDTTLPVRDEDADGADGADVDYDFDDSRGKARRKGIVLWSAAALVVVAVVLGALFIPRGNGLDAAPAAVTTMTGEGEGQEDGSVPAAATPEEIADIEYLNGNAAWNFDKLTSSMGAALAEAMTKGDLSAVASNAYFAVPGRCTNNQAIQIVELAWKAIGSGSEKGNMRKMRQSVKNNQVVLRDMVNALSTVRPSEHVNTEPRPGTKAPAPAAAEPASNPAN